MHSVHNDTRPYPLDNEGITSGVIEGTMIAKKSVLEAVIRGMFELAASIEIETSMMNKRMDKLVGESENEAPQTSDPSFANNDSHKLIYALERLNTVFNLHVDATNRLNLFI